MDDIICTILLIMYDYLFVCLFSLVAIDPKLRQLEGGGSGGRVPVERPPSGKISGLLFPGKATSEVQVLCDALTCTTSGGPRKDSTGKTDSVSSFR